MVEASVARGKDVIGNQNGRDIGLQAAGSFFLRQDRYPFDYALGIFGGSGINATDKNEEKDFAGRIVFHPVKGLDIGGSYYDGYGNWGTPATDQNRDRVGFELSYTYETLSFKAEYIAAEDGATEQDGWYLQGGYFFIPNLNNS